MLPLPSRPFFLFLFHHLFLFLFLFLFPVIGPDNSYFASALWWEQSHFLHTSCRACKSNMTIKLKPKQSFHSSNSPIQHTKIPLFLHSSNPTIPIEHHLSNTPFPPIHFKSQFACRQLLRDHTLTSHRLGNSRKPYRRSNPTMIYILPNGGYRTDLYLTQTKIHCSSIRNFVRSSCRTHVQSIH